MVVMKCKQEGKAPRSYQYIGRKGEAEGRGGRGGPEVSVLGGIIFS